MPNDMIPTSVDSPLLLLGDCIAHLRTLPKHSMDSSVLDPPAGISFMGRSWDSKTGYQPVTDRGREVLASLGSSNLPPKMRASLRETITASILRWADDNDATGVIDIDTAQAMALGAVADQGLLEPWEVGFLAFMTDVFVELLRVMKPGAHALSWALPRTQDLTMMALRFAGWEVREVVSHLFGGSFPKSLAIGKALDKSAGVDRLVSGGYIRPDGTTRDHENQDGGGRSGSEDATQSGGRTYRHGGNRDITAPATDLGKKHDGDGTALSPGHESWILARAPLAAVPPEELHTASGQDYWWSPSTLHIGTDKQRQVSAKHWPDQRAQMEVDAADHAAEMQDWTDKVDDARTLAHAAMDEAQRVWSCRPVPGFGLGLDALDPDPIDLDQLGGVGLDAKGKRSWLESIESSKPKLPAWVAWSGRSLRPSVPSRVDLRRDGDVVASTERPYTDAGIKTVAANVMRWGTGGIRIDDTRTGVSKDVPASPRKSPHGGDAGGVYGKYGTPPTTTDGWNPNIGRWPKSVLLTCALACDGDDHTPWCPSEEVGRQSGAGCGSHGGGHHTSGGSGSSITVTARGTPIESFGDAGTAARFFPRFKPHDDGCPVGELDRQSGVTTSGGGDKSGTSGTTTYSHMDKGEPREHSPNSGGASRFFPLFHYYPKASDRTVSGRDDLTNKHPTLKNPDLMRWLIRLITPRGGVVLDPFMGSGTTGWACIAEGVRFVGIEQSVEHYTIARARMDGAVGSPESAGKANESVDTGGQLGMF